MKIIPVFLNTAGWSVFAYLWLFIVLVVISPNEVTLWEAVITLLSFPVLVVTSYMAEKNFFLKKSDKEEEEMQNFSDMCMLILICINSQFSNIFMSNSILKRFGNVKNYSKIKV